MFLEGALLRLLFWLEVRFPVGAEFGPRAVACCCVSLDREEGHNWYLFSRRDPLLEPVTGRRRRRDEARDSPKPPIMRSDSCRAILHFGVLVIRVFG